MSPAPNDNDNSSPRPSLSADLKSRVIAGIVLAGAVFFADWFGVSPLSLVLLAAGIAMAWEWGAIVRGAPRDGSFFIHAASTTAATFLTAIGFAGLGLAAVFAGALILLTLEFGRRPALSGLGALYTGIPAVALLWLRGDEPWGFWAVLFIFATVAATDVAAFFCGRTFGGPKLAPRISPNKTWSGLIGGVTAAAAAGAAFSAATGTGFLPLALTGALLGLFAQAGDLGESALKRAFGVKDAGSLIPGHGGVMDRADGLVTASILAALIALAINPHVPAAALMLHR